jgi:hypothetical protein
LRPDIVIHTGNPLRANAVYDLKFPCPGSNHPDWTRYPEESPFRGLRQGDVYDTALKTEAARVAPVWGIIR